MCQTSPFSPSSLSPPLFQHQTKKKSDIAIYQNKKNEGHRVFEDMGLPLLESSLFINAEVKLS